MTEERLERIVEVRTDVLDEALTQGRLSEVKYSEALLQLDRWVEEQYKKHERKW